MLTLLHARMQGRLAENIFFPPSIHPDLRAMFNPEYLRRFGREGKRKRTEDHTVTPKKARIAEDPAPFDESGFGDGFNDGGFADGGFNDGGFGDGGFGDTGGFGEAFNAGSPRQRTPSPSLVDDVNPEDEEAPTSLTGTLSHSTIAAATLLRNELPSNGTATLHELTGKATEKEVRREDAVKMFFEVLVLASRDVIKVKQDVGFGEILVRGKEGLFRGGYGRQILV
jgi:cohesin complex subunit SCC1